MKTRGFTLIEVMVALLVIALGVGALLTTLVSAADTTGYLRDKSFAQWIALNRISELRLSTGRQQPGVTRDTVEYAGSTWQFEQSITDAGIGGLLRVDVRVARVDEARARAGIGTGTADDDEFASLGSAIGFIGTTPMRGSGLTPDWSPRAPAAPGGEGDGDADSPEGQQGPPGSGTSP